jgi:beta-phosphoglucomutase-like phosphatase (HAD superfamily)
MKSQKNARPLGARADLHRPVPRALNRSNQGRRLKPSPDRIILAAARLKPARAAQTIRKQKKRRGPGIK